MKVLLGIPTQGVVSDCWSGRVNDKHLTDNSGLLQKLLPGDIVLADHGFDIAESVGTVQAKLHIPAFTKSKKVNCQLWKLKRPEALLMSESMLSVS